MSNLTGQQIKNTYQGLLNLQNSTTGITSSIQAVQDGLGNNTGTLISTNFLSNPSLLGLRALLPDLWGQGLTTTPMTPPTGNTNNNVYFFPFYDNGFLSYSAITTAITTASSTSDVMNMYIYNGQYLSNGFGWMPFQQIYSGTTLPTTGAVNAARTTALTGVTSFSGNGPGIYWLAINITNAGVSPSVRLGGGGTLQNNTILSIAGGIYGIAQAGTTTLPSSVGSKGGITFPFTITGGVKPTYSSSDITTGYLPSSANLLGSFGFVFNVVK